MNPTVLSYKLVYPLVLSILMLACSPGSKKKVEESSEKPAEQKKYEVSESWINERVNSAEKRMAESEASRIVWQSIQAHGGLSRWFSNGVLSFRFNYMPLGGGMQRDTYQSIDTWSAKAVHQLSSSKEVKFGWDGEQAWVSPADADLKINARFWSLTPYYFVGVPFVFADEGINYELVGDEIIEGTIHQKVKITFEAGVGDAPEDYYILYIDEESKKVDALVYIVSYPGFFPNGGHSEEKFMDYIGQQTVKGITLAKEYKTYLKKKNKGFVKHVTDIELSELSFSNQFKPDYFDTPETAKLVK